MGHQLQGDPPPVLKAWFEKYGETRVGDTALKRLSQRSGVAPPTLRKVYRLQPIRADVALRVALVLLDLEAATPRVYALANLMTTPVLQHHPDAAKVLPRKRSRAA